MFQLNCASYPEVCDNHCNAFICHGLSGIALHRDTAASTTGNDDRRRTAIGCGGNNYCSGVGDCDEYPYASTFDGGLGCYPAGFNGAATSLIQSGTTRCVNPSQNRAHGAELSNFYARQGLANSAQFKSMICVNVLGDTKLTNRAVVGLPTARPVSPLCDALATQGDRACPDESTGLYRFRSTPATPSCPARSKKAQAMMGSQTGIEESTIETKVRTVYTDANQTIAVYGTGPGPVVGGKVWTPSDDIPEGGFISTITKVEE
ncbi:hypothetical protein VKT23_012058 [Stygiomarasmius scandens]